MVKMRSRPRPSKARESTLSARVGRKFGKNPRVKVTEDDLAICLTRPCSPALLLGARRRRTQREAKLMLLITQITKTETSPALANTPDTTAALNKITPSAYAILSSAHRITPMKRTNTK